MQIAVIIALLLGGGLSVASEHALPDETLYPIKVEVNEKIRSSLALGAEAEARWEARQAERRLEEAEALAKENRLNAEMKTEIQTRFNEHVHAFNEHVTTIENEGKTTLAFELQSDFEANLETHESLLANMEEGENNSLIVDVRSALQGATQNRAGLEAMINVSTETEEKTEDEEKVGDSEDTKENESVDVQTKQNAEVDLDVNL